MIRRLCLALAACVGLTGSVCSAQDFDPQILKYFPGKWELRAADGTVIGTNDWKVVSGGKAVAGAGSSVQDGANYHLAGWEPGQKKWVHHIFEASGRYARFEVTKYEGSTYIGTVYAVDPNGKAVSGKCRNRVVDENHFEITQFLNGESTVMHFFRKKD